jgi:VIT1/CCC1 family predicted Fe2+/Mn2+ transporter
MPVSFKAKWITGFRRRLLLDIAPAILQVHVFFFIGAIVLIAVVSCLLTPIPLNIVIAVLSFLLLMLVLFIGGLYYPNKLNKMLEDLSKK